MSTKLKDLNHLNGSVVEVKSKFDAEFRRFAIRKFSGEKFEDLYQTLQRLHGLQSIPFVIFYTDKDGDLLPINNNENYMKALTSPLTVLRISVQRKDENWSDLIGYSTLNRKKDAKNKILGQMPLSSHSANKNSKTTPLKIGMPEDFRQVSAIIDVDILPQTLRRVRLLKHGSDRPLGFYIRDGNSVKVTPTGIVRVPGIFISRLVPGGLAESTGLLSVEDEVVEVNGIEVAGKTLDQVTDMMIANSSNLIITVKPANQRLTKSPSDSEALTDAQLSRSSPAMRNTHQRSSQMSASAASTSSFPSNQSYSMEDDDDMDEIRDLTAETKLGQIGNNSGSSGTGSDRPSSSSSTTARRESVKAMRPISNGLHVTKIIIDGKSNGIIHENEQVFTL